MNLQKVLCKLFNVHGPTYWMTVVVPEGIIMDGPIPKVFSCEMCETCGKNLSEPEPIF